MNLYRKHYKKLRVFSILSFTSGSLWVISQIRKTREILDNAIDTSIIDLLEPAIFQNSNECDEFASSNWVQTYEPPETALSKTWNSLKFIYARRLLNLANTENMDIRRRAIRQLANIKKLDNWQYALLAHTCDACTAVGLARTSGVNPRFFLQPPLKYMNYNHYMLVRAMKDFMMYLERQSDHPCLKKFINQAFLEDPQKMIDDDLYSTELSKFIHSERDILLPCVETISHHTDIDRYARDVVSYNGLYLLMEIYNRNAQNLPLNILLSRILCNISVSSEFLEDIHKSGWLCVLAQWANHPDIRVSLPAASALANLDTDNPFKYCRQIFALHPLYRNTDTTNVDVVVVHGLLGGVFFTWRQRDKNETTLGFLGKKGRKASITSEHSTPDVMLKSSDPVTREYMEGMQEQAEEKWDELGNDFEFVCNDIPTNTNCDACEQYTCKGSNICVSEETQNSTPCWPKDWLPEDCPNLRIVGVNYDTSISMWTALCPEQQIKRTLDERCDEIMARLVKAGIGKRPVVWITHSMGGLLVKNILHKALNGDNPEYKNLCSQTKGIVFYSTPHSGSKLASLSQAASLLLWPSIEVQELRQESPNLLQIQKNFLRVVEEFPMKIISFVETKSTVLTALKFNIMFVEPQSGNPQVGEYYEVPQDHLGICKPANRHSFLYLKVVNLLKEIIREERNETKSA